MRDIRYGGYWVWGILGMGDIGYGVYWVQGFTDLVLRHGRCPPELELQLDIGRAGLNSTAEWGSQAQVLMQLRHDCTTLE